ncbi:hypothetical protein [Elizabethkingia meningoseptica]|uniref:hypothetical protein n=1 Tax=Elizabethkingia meningoseptica TaxID=238 RepID=UPI0016298C9C|nr:hypothetical protein [Elizabethkingia meningoseptica]
MISNSLNLTVKSWYLHFIAGAFFIFTGIYVVTVSPDLYPSLNKLLGTAFILSGLVFLVFSVRNHSKIAGWGWYMIYGILIAGMGIYLTEHRDESLFFATGFASLFRCGLLLGISFELQKHGHQAWGNLSISSSIGFVFSIMVFMDPILICLAFILMGISDIILSLTFRKTNRSYRTVKYLKRNYTN